MVDALLGELQTLIKPLGVLFGGWAASAARPSCATALILDVGSLVADQSLREHLRQLRTAAAVH